MMKKKIPSYLSSSDDSSDSSSDESEDIVQPIPKIISKNSTLSSAATKSNLISEKPKAQTLTAGLVSISGTKRPIQNITNLNDGNPNGKTVVNVNEDEPTAAKKPTTTTTTMPEPEPLVDSSLMAVTTPADVKEYQNSYVFEMDMPGMKSSDIKVEVEDDNVVVISGERKREEEGGGVKYLNMEKRRRFGKFTGRFLLPEDANVDAVSASCQDGVLSVTVLKKLPPPPNPNKPRRTIEVVKIA